MRTLLYCCTVLAPWFSDPVTRLIFTRSNLSCEISNGLNSKILWLTPQFFKSPTRQWLILLNFHQFRPNFRIFTKVINFRLIRITYYFILFCLNNFLSFSFWITRHQTSHGQKSLGGILCCWRSQLWYLNILCEFWYKTF